MQSNDEAGNSYLHKAPPFPELRLRFPVLELG